VLPLDYLKSILEYKEGNLYWKEKISDKIKAGQKAGSKSGSYEIIKINKHNYYTHQLVFYYHNGFIPETIDHIDHNKRNNKIENLRAATYSQNLQNTRKFSNASSKFKGVCYDKKRNKWVARIKLIDKRIHLGYFENEVEAAKAYDAAAILNFGEFAQTNRSKYNENS